MEKIEDILQRARRNRGRRQAMKPSEKAEAPRRNADCSEGRGGYGALMRSHDRMHSRHISGARGT